MSRETQRLMAEALGVSERTLRNWRRGAKVEPKALGRPATPREKRYLALLRVRHEVKRQGWQAGWRPVLVGAELPIRLVQESLSALKKRHRKKLEERRARARLSVEVLGSDVVWAEDSTHLGHIGRRAVLGEVVKDRGSLANVLLGVGRAVNGEDVVRLLEAGKNDDRLPLVWATDNGPAYKSHEVEEFCRREKVVHLFSRPRTPQDNAAAERGIRELKAEAGLGKGRRIVAEQDAALCLSKAATLLDNRPRPSKAGRTALQLEESLPKGPQLVSREEFYADACRAMGKAVKGGGTKRQQRQRERLAVYRTLEKFHLIKVNRGGKPCLLNQEFPEDIL